MDWLNALLLIAAVAGLALFFYGVKNNLVMPMFLGGSAVIAVLFHLINLTFLLPFAPPLAMGIAYLIKKKSDST